MENLKGSPSSKPESFPRQAIEAEISRLEQEFKKGRSLLESTQADLLRIDGALVTLRGLLKFPV